MRTAHPSRLGSPRDRADEVHADRGPHPDPLGEPPARPARRPAAAAQPGHDAARRARRPDADLPDGADRPGGLGRARGRDPRARARGLQAVAPDAALPRAPPGARARYPGAHLLQVRGRLPRRLAQAEQRGRAGVRQQGGRHRAAGDGDRRRPVGLGAGARLHAVRAGVRRLHGGRQLRPEALPAGDDGELGRHGDPLAQRHHRLGPRPGRAPHRLAGDRDLRGGRGGGQGRRHQLRARLGAQPRVPAPDGDRPGGAGADGDGRRRARRGGGLRRRRVELRRA